MDSTDHPITKSPGPLWWLAWRLRSPAARRARFQALLLGHGRSLSLSVREREARMRVLLRQGLGKERGFTEDPGQGQTLAAATMAAAGMSDDQRELLALALEAGVDVNHRQKDGWFDTLLTRAVRCGRVQNVRLLMRQGADPDLIEGSGNNALNLAGRDDSVELAIVISEVLINEGANPNSAGKRAAGDEKVKYHIQMPPVLAALRYNRLQLVHALLKAGARADVVEPQSGNSAVHLCRGDHMVRHLQTLGFDLHATNALGCNGLAMALLERDATKASALIEAGVDPKTRTRLDPVVDPLTKRYREVPANTGCCAVHFLGHCTTLPGAVERVRQISLDIEKLYPDCWAWKDHAGRTPAEVAHALLAQGLQVDKGWLTMADDAQLQASTAPVVRASKPRLRL